MIYFVKIFINDIIVQLLNESQANAFFTKLNFYKVIKSYNLTSFL